MTQQDSPLLLRLKSKSKEAFYEIYQSYKNLVYFKAYTILNNKEDAEDIVQATYIRLMERIDRLEGDVDFKNLLAKIGENLALDLYRKKMAHPEIPDSEQVEESGEESGKEAELLLTLKGVLEKEEAEIVALHIVYDYGFADIAKMKGLSLGVVQGKYYKALKTLKKYYKEEKR